MNKKLFFLIILTSCFQLFLNSSEMIIGEESIGNNISVVFEGAPKDKIFSSPNNKQLPKSETDIHIEALINWKEDIEIPSQIPGSFIPYLIVSANIQNQNTKEKKILILEPHLNLIDGFHYAKNVKLPGSTKDLYTITFNVKNNLDQLLYHQDWKDKYKIPIFLEKSFTYKDLDFFYMSKVVRF